MKKYYPIKADTSTLDVDELKHLSKKINEFVDVLEATNIMIDYADSTRLLKK